MSSPTRAGAATRDLRSPATRQTLRACGSVRGEPARAPAPERPLNPRHGARARAAPASPGPRAMRRAAPPALPHVTARPPAAATATRASPTGPRFVMPVMMFENSYSRSARPRMAKPLRVAADFPRSHPSPATGCRRSPHAAARRGRYPGPPSARPSTTCSRLGLLRRRLPLPGASPGSAAAAA